MVWQYKTDKVPFLTIPFALSLPLNTSRLGTIDVKYTSDAITVPFHILSNSVFTNDPAI
jgi:hypothetical protein